MLSAGYCNQSIWVVIVPRKYIGFMDEKRNEMGGEKRKEAESLVSTESVTREFPPAKQNKNDIDRMIFADDV